MALSRVVPDLTGCRRSAVSARLAGAATAARCGEQQAQVVSPQHGETRAGVSDHLESEQFVELQAAAVSLTM
jgi:hypothetical protein